MSSKLILSPHCACMVDPKYLNELVHGIGIPAKQTSSCSYHVSHRVFVHIIINSFV